MGNEPTFVNSVRREVIDLSLGSSNVCKKITKWHVSSEPSLSDHRHIHFEISDVEKTVFVYRDPKRTNWNSYKEDLKADIEANINSVRNNTFEIEAVADQLQKSILTSYQSNCPSKTTTTNNKVGWWNNNLARMRNKARKLFNRAKETGDWDTYSNALTEYNKRVRKAKRDSWKRLYQDVENTSERARLHRILAKEPLNPVGTLKNPTGTFTATA